MWVFVFDFCYKTIWENLILLSHVSLEVFYSSLELTKCFIAAEAALWLNKGF